MAGGTPSGEDTRRLTRRGVLAVAGASAVAGCSSLDGLGEDARGIRTFDLPDVDADSVPEPLVAPSIPVEVDSAYLAGNRDSTTAMLATLPTPLGPSHVPNGHVREHLTDAADTATDRLDEARTARTGAVALRALRDARGHARYAAAGWGFVDEGLTVDGLRREHGQVLAAARAAREEHTYTGTDPVRAALVHARIEDWLDRAVDTGERRIQDEGDLLRVAQWGELAEEARAYLDDSRHLSERFDASLPDGAGTVEDTLRRAAEALAADARSRRADLPPEPDAEEWGLAERVVHELRREPARGPYRVADAHGPASAVVDLTGRLATFRALDGVQERVEAGAITSVETAEEVREARTAAYAALEAGLAESPDADLARTVLSHASWRVSHADRELDRLRSRGRVSPAGLDDVMQRYLVAAAVGRATPEACQQVVEALTAS